MTDQPYLSWCLIARNDEKNIEACLQSIRERTPNAEIVVVDTMSSDRTPEIAKKYADVFEQWRGPRGDWDEEMPWFDDAAAARNRSFELASGKWRAWIDTDDRLAGPEEAERILRANGRWMPGKEGDEIEGEDPEPIGLEDALRILEEKHPEADCVWAPYAYQRGDGDKIKTWQTRERIVRWDPERWGWREPSHEILVPITGGFPPRVEFSHLLFVHEKDFSPQSFEYATKRHYEVLIKQYEAGDATHRRCWYLAIYARSIDPKREKQFLDDSLDLAFTQVDKAFANIELGHYYKRCGLYFDALTHYAAATAAYPDLPESWCHAADLAADMNDHKRALEWFERAAACDLIPQSRMAPRDLFLRYPLKHASVYVDLAEQYTKHGRHDDAVTCAKQAFELAKGVLENDMLRPEGLDHQEVYVVASGIENYLAGLMHAKNIDQLCNYLVNNDEPAKALSVIENVPHTLEVHPLVEKWRGELAKVERHMTDPVAYGNYYKTAEENNLLLPSPEPFMDADDPVSQNMIARAHWAAEWIRELCPEGSILDVGCFDGQSAIPLLLKSRWVSYVGLDYDHSAIDRFRENLVKFGLEDRDVQLFKLGEGGDYVDFEDFLQRSDAYMAYDAVVWFEVIEHVPRPVDELIDLSRALHQDGIILVSTPWGSHDLGHPYDVDGSRDIRSHLRAYTMRTMLDDLRSAGFSAYDLTHYQPKPTRFGDTMHVMAQFPNEKSGPSVSFAVAAALWDWNARTVEREGIGASEEMIIELAKYLALDRDANVFGPVPELDVHQGVPYWSHEYMKHERHDIVVASRAPHWGTTIDADILWLQDAYYSDLNPEVAEKYKAIVCVSEWHKELTHKQNGVPLDKLHVCYNFIKPEQFADVFENKKHDHFIYASSPDRGLVRLLRLWPKIKEALPDATLSIFYGWRGCTKLGNGATANPGWVERHEKMRKAYEQLRFQEGVYEYGMVNHETIAKAFIQAGVWAYPTDFTETCCTNAIKARAAGAVPVTTPLAALNETAACDQGFFVDFGDDYDDRFVEACVKAVEVSNEDRYDMSIEAVANYDIIKAVKFWSELIEKIS